MANKNKSFIKQIQNDIRKEETVDDILHPEKSSILAQAEARKETKKEKKPEPKKKYTLQVRARESRSRRLQLLLTPSLYAKVELKAKKLGISVNELINTVLEDVVED